MKYYYVIHRAIFISHEEDTGKMLRFDVKSLDMKTKKAMLELSKQPMDIVVKPSKATKVEILQTWGEKSIQIAGVDEAELHVES
jgi:hypothetical protein